MYYLLCCCFDPICNIVSQFNYSSTNTKRLKWEHTKAQKCRWYEMVNLGYQSQLQ